MGQKNQAQEFITAFNRFLSQQKTLRIVDSNVGVLTLWFQDGSKVDFTEPQEVTDDDND